ncbi:MAG: glycosyltransferase family 4 protein [Rhodospirillales bacterium]|jgi:glycosyltransferase involved in cell wall biosynthesis|nr:glycosyltransferase family 4 protein [Rhodospirillales bacterium]MDP6644756.1 glycosyltransferase family 4 protein [Rhodospirillales bacterium]MDP6840488.1 glycosyltransferase family 4 protein [Rhodospirillales bacterium]
MPDPECCAGDRRGRLGRGAKGGGMNAAPANQKAGHEAGGRPLRLAMVAQFPVHYHLTLYRHLAHDPAIDLDVLFMQKAWADDGFEPDVNAVIDWGVEMFAGYPSKIFRNFSPWRNRPGFWKFVNLGLIWRVLTGPYDAVYIHGHNHFSHVMCMAAARLGGKKLILRNIAYNLGERSKLKRMARRALYGALYALPSVCLYIGRNNKDYYRDFGVGEARLVHAPHVVDNAFFTSEVTRLAGREAEIKASFGIEPGQKVVLFCAKFMEKKQPLRAVEAFARAGLDDDWVLLMVGEGALLPVIKKRVAAEQYERIMFTGFLDQSRVSEAYAISEMLILPSSHQETWGLVVNEALNFGCAIVASDRVGCVPELVEGRTGVVFPHSDTEALAAAIKRLARDPEFLIACRAEARDVISGWNVDAYGRALHRALGIQPS